MKTKHNKATKHVYVSERTHRALKSESARHGMTIDEYLAWVLAARAPDALSAAERTIKKQNGKQKKQKS